MSHKANDLFMEDVLQKRQEWLVENGRQDGDVMEDEKGEYILIDGENNYEKLYLSKELTLKYALK